MPLDDDCGKLVMKKKSKNNYNFSIQTIIQISQFLNFQSLEKIIPKLLKFGRLQDFAS